MRRRQKGQKNKGAPRWMVTYSDMVTLILVFFILLFSMSQIDLRKFHSITESFQSRAVLDFIPSSVPSDEPFFTDMNDRMDISGGMKDLLDELDDLEQEKTIDLKEATIQQLYTDVQQFLTEENLFDVVEFSRAEEGVVLVFQDNILFNSGEATILASGEPFLIKVSELIKSLPNTVRIEGHTDTKPMSSFRYPSNWELSGARAGSVVRYFINEHDIPEERFLIAGYGETRPIAPNDTTENRRKNRRVEIVILSEYDVPRSQEN